MGRKGCTGTLVQKMGSGIGQLRSSIRSVVQRRWVVLAVQLICSFGAAKVNTCYNAIDYHIESGRGSQTALIYDSPVTNTVRKYTFLQMQDEVAKVAGALHARGVGKGDRVLIYMPMIPEGACPYSPS